MENNTIRFLLNHCEITIVFNESTLFKPTTTILNYLRGYTFLKGTKEGCAEGDCGACTVVIADYSEGKLFYKAYDSCLVFLPFLHGKHLITVEGLKYQNKLHPVQQAMVDFHGSQCGYCTPGFVMSLFALYHQDEEFKEPDEINDVLSGNLCRCTGYRPIVDAAKSILTLSQDDHFKANETKVVKQLKQISSQKESVNIVGKKYIYYKPKTLNQALKFKDGYRNILVVNGCTDIALRVTKQKENLPRILDLSSISEMKEMKEIANFIEYGSGVTLEQLRRHCKSLFPALYNMLNVFGSRQIRNIGTLGGNVANASPIGDTPPVLMAYNATVVLQSFAEVRNIKLTDFIEGYRKTGLKENELLVKIMIPWPTDNTIVKSYKVSKRKHLDIATVSSGFNLKLNNNIVEDINLYYGGMAANVQNATKTESFLKGKPWTMATVNEAMSYLNQDFTPISDARSGKEARMIMAGNLLEKFWVETAS